MKVGICWEKVEFLGVQCANMISDFGKSIVRTMKVILLIHCKWLKIFDSTNHVFYSTHCSPLLDGFPWCVFITGDMISFVLLRYSRNLWCLENIFIKDSSLNDSKKWCSASVSCINIHFKEPPPHPTFHLRPLKVWLMFRGGGEYQHCF